MCVCVCVFVRMHVCACSCTQGAEGLISLGGKGAGPQGVGRSAGLANRGLRDWLIRVLEWFGQAGVLGGGRKCSWPQIAASFVSLP